MFATMIDEMHPRLYSKVGQPYLQRLASYKRVLYNLHYFFIFNCLYNHENTLIKQISFPYYCYKNKSCKHLLKARMVPKGLKMICIYAPEGIKIKEYTQKTCYSFKVVTILKRRTVGKSSNKPKNFIIISYRIILSPLNSVLYL